MILQIIVTYSKVYVCTCMYTYAAHHNAVWEADLALSRGHFIEVAANSRQIMALLVAVTEPSPTHFTWDNRMYSSA